MNDRECLRTSTNVWGSLCDHCELMANCIRKPIRHTFATCETSITFETPHKNDRECLRTATYVWRSFTIITNSWRTAFVSPFAIYVPQCETSITSRLRNRLPVHSVQAWRPWHRNYIDNKKLLCLKSTKESDLTHSRNGHEYIDTNILKQNIRTS